MVPSRNGQKGRSGGIVNPKFGRSKSFGTTWKVRNRSCVAIFGLGIGGVVGRMSIKKWFTGKTNTPNNNINKQDKVKQLSIFPNKQSTCSSSSTKSESCNPVLLNEQSVQQVSYVDGNDSQSCEQIAKEKSVRKFGLFGLWWKGNRNSNQGQLTQDTATEEQNEEQLENNQLLRDPTVLAFLESVDRRLNDRRLPLEKSDMIRLETFQAQAMADGCNELLDIIEYFEWENDRCLLVLRSAGPSKPFAAVVCSS